MYIKGISEDQRENKVIIIIIIIIIYWIIIYLTRWLAAHVILSRKVIIEIMDCEEVDGSGRGHS